MSCAGVGVLPLSLLACLSSSRPSESRGPSPVSGFLGGIVNTSALMGGTVSFRLVILLTLAVLGWRECDCDEPSDSALFRPPPPAAPDRAVVLPLEAADTLEAEESSRRIGALKRVPQKYRPLLSRVPATV